MRWRAPKRLPIPYNSAVTTFSPAGGNEVVTLPPQGGNKCVTSVIHDSTEVVANHLVTTVFGRWERGGNRQKTAISTSLLPPLERIEGKVMGEVFRLPVRVRARGGDGRDMAA
jgi:hypothetical protein